MSVIGHHIISVAVDAERRTVTVGWDDGSHSIKHMGPLIAAKRIFRPLADPTLFAAVRIIQDGRAIAWGDDIDLCADALWFEAHPAQNPFSPFRETA